MLQFNLNRHRSIVNLRMKTTNIPSGTCIVRYTRKFSTREIVPILARTPTQNTTQRLYFIWICAEWSRIITSIYIHVHFSISSTWICSLKSIDFLIRIHSSDTNNRFTWFILLTRCTYVCVYIYISIRLHWFE